MWNRLYEIKTNFQNIRLLCLEFWDNHLLLDRPKALITIFSLLIFVLQVLTCCLIHVRRANWFELDLQRPQLPWRIWHDGIYLEQAHVSSRLTSRINSNITYDLYSWLYLYIDLYIDCIAIGSGCFFFDDTAHKQYRAYTAYLGTCVLLDIMIKLSNFLRFSVF